MADSTPTRPRKAADVVRTHRLEVVDRWGRPQVVVGEGLRGAGEEPVFGVSLLDRAGRERAWLQFDPDYGCQLGMTQDGNQVLSLQVGDAHDNSRPGPAITLYDPSGASVAELGVDSAGQPYGPGMRRPPWTARLGRSFRRPIARRRR